jgi:DNA-binding NarL/FixJ family response regulator
MADQIERNGQRPAPVRLAARATNGTIVALPRRNGKALPLGHMAEAKILVALSQREFVRGCLSCWLQGFCPEFEIKVVGSIDDLQTQQWLTRASAILLDASTPRDPLHWLETQVGQLRALELDAPLMAIVEPSEIAALEPLIERLGVHGYVPTSSSMEVAAAALRLVVAGGTYFPRTWTAAQPVERVVPPPEPAPEATSDIQLLTPRERSVLDLLGCGMPNKIIAYRLDMSLSTVKVHVHNIIRKLKVQNRTEAALAGRAQSAGRPLAG